MNNSIAVDSKILALSAEGNLLDPTEWTEKVAAALAEKEGITLTEDHWKIIRLARNYYQEFNISPVRKLLKKNITRELGEECATDSHLKFLFPGTVVQQVNRIAGLPPAFLDAELDAEMADTKPPAPKMAPVSKKITPAAKETFPDSIHYNGKDYALTKYGNLAQGSDWNQKFAEFLAQREGLTLTDEHWFILNFLRQFYFEYGVTPMVRLLMKHLAEAYGKDKANEQYLYQLFPKGPARQGSRIAGLPEPQGCID